MIVAIVGLVLGGCFGPLPGIAALIMGLVALSQIKKEPDKYAGRSFAIAAVILGSVSILFYLVLFLWFVLGIGLGGFG
jgi:hypothetical protein